MGNIREYRYAYDAENQITFVENLKLEASGTRYVEDEGTTKRDWIVQLELIIDDEGLESTVIKTNQIRAVLETAIGIKKSKQFKKTGKRKGRVGSNLEDTDAQLIGQAIKQSIYLDGEEFAADAPKEKIQFYIVPNMKVSNKDIFKIAKSVQFKKSLSSAYSVCSNTQIDINEAKYIVSECLKSHRFEDFVIIFQLLLGASPKQLKSINLKKDRVLLELNLPKHDEYSLNYPTKRRYTLDLPYVLFGKVNNKMFKELNEGCVRKHFNRLFGKKNLKYSNIQDCLPQFIKLKRYDCSYRELLSSNINRSPQIYYTSIKDVELKLFWNHYLETLGFSAAPIRSGEIDECVGSNLSIKYQYVSRLFSLLTQSIKNNIRTGDYFKALNLYTIYLYNLMSICTCHRPVIGSFETLSQICFTTNSVWIEDKVSNNASNPRVVFLPQLVIDQINNYCNFLRVGWEHFKISNPQFSQSIKNQLDAIANLFVFYFKELNEIKPLTPSVIKEVQKSIWPLKLNWHRHVVRSYLVYMNVPSSTIDLFMGHQVRPLHDNGLYGSKSYSSSKEVVSVLSDFIQELGIKYINFMEEERIASWT